MQKLNKHYISDIDKKLREFDNQHPKSHSQQAEIKKYQRIGELRDQQDNENDRLGSMWD